MSFTQNVENPPIGMVEMRIRGALIVARARATVEHSGKLIDTSQKLIEQITENRAAIQEQLSDAGDRVAFRRQLVTAALAE